MNTRDSKYRSNFDQNKDRMKAPYSSSNSDIHKKSQPSNKRVKERRRKAKSPKKQKEIIVEREKRDKPISNKLIYNKEIKEHTILQIENEVDCKRRGRSHRRAPIRLEISSQSSVNINYKDGFETPQRIGSQTKARGDYKELKHAVGDFGTQQLNCPRNQNERHLSCKNAVSGGFKINDQGLKPVIKKSKSQPWTSNTVPFCRNQMGQNVKYLSSKRGYNYNCTTGRISIQGDCKQPYLDKTPSEDCLNSHRKVPLIEKEKSASDDLKVLFSRQTNKLQIPEVKNENDLFGFRNSIRTSQQVFFAKRKSVPKLRDEIKHNYEKECKIDKYVDENVNSIFYPTKCMFKYLCKKHPFRFPVPSRESIDQGHCSFCKTINGCRKKTKDSYQCKKIKKKKRFFVLGPYYCLRYFLIGVLAIIWLPFVCIGLLCGFILDLLFNVKGHGNIGFCKVFSQHVLNLKPPTEVNSIPRSICSHKKTNKSKRKKSANTNKKNMDSDEEMKNILKNQTNGRWKHPNKDSLYRQGLGVHMAMHTPTTLPSSHPASTFSTYRNEPALSSRCDLHRPPGEEKYFGGKRKQKETPDDKRKIRNTYGDRRKHEEKKTREIDKSRRRANLNNDERRRRDEHRYKTQYNTRLFSETKGRGDRQVQDSRKRYYEDDRKLYHNHDRARYHNVATRNYDNRQGKKRVRLEENNKMHFDRKIQNMEDTKPKSASCQYVLPETTVVILKEEEEEEKPPVQKIIYHHHMRNRQINFNPIKKKRPKPKPKDPDPAPEHCETRVRTVICGERSLIACVCRGFRQTMCALTVLEKLVWGPRRCCCINDHRFGRCRGHLCFWGVINKFYFIFLFLMIFVASIFIWLPLFVGAIVITRIMCWGLT